ncbi:MAG TPA: cytochrome b [Ramlibacter sp.]|uniref:cytochrome b n=1 Tax=Ramlibacter sp. TaxID=1917967 RepID=UPI002ED5B14C
MLLANTPGRYGALAILLHWGMAGLLLVLVALGLYMGSLPDTGFDRVKITLILVHKALGLLALWIVLLRLAWRVGNVLPRLVEGTPMWQQVAARFVHLCLYALMLALPLTGWLMSSAGGYPVSFFGWFELPDFVPRNEAMFRIWINVHHWLAYALMLLVALHMAAALQHHWVDRDDTLLRMWHG